MIDDKSLSQDDDDEGGEAFDLSKMDREEEDDMAGVKVHEIKFDEYGIMDDGVDDSTADKLKAAGVSEGGGLTHSLPHGIVWSASEATYNLTLFGGHCTWENSNSIIGRLPHIFTVTLDLCKFTINGDLFATSMTAYPISFSSCWWSHWSHRRRPL